MRKNEELSFASMMAVVLKLENMLHVSICEMFTFCDVLHETKQKMQTNSRECAVRTGNRLLTDMCGWLCLLTFVAYSTGSRTRFKAESFTRPRRFGYVKT